MMMLNLIEKLGLAVLFAFTVLLFYLAFVMVPVMMYAESECLKLGYPKAHVTVFLERYCSTLDGVVTQKVVKP